MNKIKNIFIVGIIMLFAYSSIIAQKQTENSFLLNLFEPDQVKTSETLHESKSVIENNKILDITIHNINKHLKETAILRAKGKSEEEINMLFNLQKVVAGTGSIVGTVYESDGITPIQYFCSIEAYNEYGKYMGSDYTYANTNGEYSITDLPSGKYYVRTSSGEYADEYYDNVDSWQDATFVDVFDDQETNGVDFSLLGYLYGPGQGAISGYVFDTEGNPVVNCFIAAQSDTYGNGGITDINGMYTVGELTTGSYKIHAEYYGDDKNYVDEWYDEAENQNEATSVPVVEPSTTKNIDFILKNGGAIMGTVIEPNGSAVYTNEAEVMAIDNSGNYISFSRTDENGEFLVTKLSTGTYKLQVFYNGMKNYIEGNYNLENWYDGTNDFSNAIPISVIVSDTTKNIIINLHEGGKISGKVYNYNGALLDSDCEVTAYLNDQNDYVGFAWVENGIYSIDKLPTGQFKLYAKYNGYTQYLGQEPASEWYDGASDFYNADFVEVFAPNTTGNIDFTLVRGGYLSGRVFDSNRQPLSYCGDVVAYNLNFEMIGISGIYNDGLYFITGLPSGEYKLRISYSGEEDYADEWYNDKSSFEAATIVTVNAPNQTANINFRLDNPGIIQGFITDIHGTHLTDDECLIDILCFDAVTGEYISDRYNSFNGGYQFELQAQNYKISAVSYYANWLPKNENDSLASTFYENGLSFSDPNTQTISLEANTTETLNNIIMEKASGSISGTIYNNNEPITEGVYLVYVFDEDGYLSTASYYMDQPTQIDGRYFTGGLRPGNYYLLVMVGDPRNDFISLWYKGFSEDININTFSPKVTIPEEAIPVSVTEGKTAGVDFYFPLTDIDQNEEIELIKEFKLKQNYPNPFNPTTTINYSIPHQSNVTLKIFDVLGREIAVLVNKEQSVGSYEVEFDASNLTSGIYFYRIQGYSPGRAGQFVETKKMLLLR